MHTTISATARRFTLALLLIAFASSAPQASGQSTAVPEAAFVPLADRYAKEIRPLVVHCQDCHAGDTTEADVDLGAFATLGQVRKHPQIWQKVGEMLDTRQMPPKDAEPQPEPAERTLLETWVHDILTLEAEPGPAIPAGSSCTA